jgi:hypothetical protein
MHNNLKHGDLTNFKRLQLQGSTTTSLELFLIIAIDLALYIFKVLGFNIDGIHISIRPHFS